MTMPPSSFRPPPGATLREAHAHLAQHALAQLESLGVPVAGLLLGVSILFGV